MNIKVKTIRNNIYHFLQKWLYHVLPLPKISQSLPLYLRYLSDWHKYSLMQQAEQLQFLNSYPCLFDRTATTGFDKHYVYQSIWAMKAIKASRSVYHVDIGSHIFFVGLLSVITKVTFIDIRPVKAEIENFEPCAGDILNLDFSNNSVPSLSCLHVAEHIGLGRYGDPLDPEGTKKATRELARVLAPGGSLYFSLPVGVPRVCFNAHRIHAPQQIRDYFHDLTLVEFSGVDDQGNFRQHLGLNDLANARYACGLFHFTKQP